MTNLKAEQIQLNQKLHQKEFQEELQIWQAGRFEIELKTPKIMGIVNVTPDSFSDGGKHNTTAAAIRHAEQLIKEGAHILDIGGESTRPNSPAVSLEEEKNRILPVVQAAVTLGVPISVDTYKPEVMQRVLDMGADIINDVWALRQKGALEIVAKNPNCGVCIMHMHKDPQTMQQETMPDPVLPQVRDFLAVQTQRLIKAGVGESRIIWDMGIGFGKTVKQNLKLLKRQDYLLQSGYPLLAGWSRKSSIATVMQNANIVENLDPASCPRVTGSIAAGILSVERGAKVIRVHDVRHTAYALAVFNAMNEV